jgi:hypothetical protein
VAGWRMNGRIGYRLLLRTANSVFKNDHYAIKSAKIKLREEFLKNKNVNNPKELGQPISSLLAHEILTHLISR